MQQCEQLQCKLDLLIQRVFSKNSHLNPAQRQIELQERDVLALQQAELKEELTKLWPPITSLRIQTHFIWQFPHGNYGMRGKLAYQQAPETPIEDPHNFDDSFVEDRWEARPGPADSLSSNDSFVCGKTSHQRRGGGGGGGH